METPPHVSQHDRPERGSVKEDTTGKGDRVSPIIVGRVRAPAHVRDQETVSFHGSKCLVRETAGGVGISAGLTSDAAAAASHGEKILPGVTQAGSVGEKARMTENN